MTGGGFQLGPDPKAPPAGARGSAADRLRAVLVGPTERVRSGAVVLGLALLVAVLAVWMQRVVLLTPGQVAETTRLARVPVEVVDEAATLSARRAARDQAPRVYVPDGAVLEQLRVAIAELPEVLAEAQSLDDLRPEWRDDFGLTPELFARLKSATATEPDRARWKAMAARLDAAVRRTPLLDARTYQDERAAINELLELRLEGLRALDGASPYLASDERAPRPEGAAGGAGGVLVRTGEAVNAGSPSAGEALATLAARAGFTGEALAVVRNRLIARPAPTFRLDPTATDARRAQAAEAEQPRTVKFPAGAVVVARGDIVTTAQADLALAEHRATLESGGVLGPGRWRDAGVAGLGMLVALGLGAYVSTYSPAVAASPRRLARLAALFALCAAGSCVAAAAEPKLIGLAITAPAVLFSLVVVISHGRRASLAMGALLVLAVTLALEQPVSLAAAALVGVGVISWRLRELRRRQTLVATGLLAAVSTAVAVGLSGFMRRPIADGTGALIEAGLWQTLADAGASGAAALLVTLLVLGVLPWIERLFDVTTGLTLVELRDPRHPLLRELQRRAPGTYNHSLNVANLAEAAAEAIGADGLLAYVGALYHDVGKMAKPDFFVENQTAGFNRHERLAPAASLMMITGHVRDGLELARSHRLPGQLMHFIESHHGTTLVEYFFHRARKQAEQARAAIGAAPGPQAATMPLSHELEPPDELEYRYPGPKPRTREAAVLMLCDASESASRTLPEPTPARVEALVRAIAHRRLTDGQFDDSDLTLAELNKAVEAVASALAAINHPRIAYPDGQRAVPAGATPGTQGAPVQLPATPPPAGAAGAPGSVPAGASALTQPLTGRR